MCEKPYSCLDREFCYNDGICYLDQVKENNHTYSRPGCECKNTTKYKGVRCEQCDILTCLNGGYCTYVNQTNAECRCSAGYYGQNCGESLCDSFDNCSKNGFCRLVGGLPRCICRSGFIGKKCDQDTCSGYCLNGGICQRENNKRKCVCPSDYSGKQCELNTCKCLNGGICSNAVCICPSNFMGQHCERFIQNFTSCKKIDCNNGGICKINENDQQAYCECTKDFKGIFCDIPLNGDNLNCKDYYCLNGGQCTIVNRTLTCK